MAEEPARPREEESGEGGGSGRWARAERVRGKREWRVGPGGERERGERLDACRPLDSHPTVGEMGRRVCADAVGLKSDGGERGRRDEGEERVRAGRLGRKGN